MRTLILMNNFLPGGAESASLTLARGLAQRGCEIHLVVLNEAGTMRSAWQEADVAIHGPLLRFARDPLGTLRLARLMRDRRFDNLLLLDALRNVMFTGLLGSWRSKVPAVLWCHTSPNVGWIPDITRRLRRYRRFGWPDRIVALSQHHRDELIAGGIDAGCIDVIHNGVDVEAIAAAAPAELPALAAGRCLFIQVANDQPHKDFNTLLAAGGILQNRDVPVVILLAGRGTAPADLAGRIATARAEKVLIPLGPRSDIPSLLAAADGFVLSAHTEVFNVATLEAMAAGLPVVTTDLPAFAEMYDDGAQGLKVAPRDPAALAGAIEALVRDPARRARLAEAATQRATQFSREVMCDAFEKLLASPR